jgi:flagellin-like hook-associated protein FlgL
LNGFVDDKPRGGSPDADPNAFYDANTKLKYIDRLPNSGMVRTNTTVRAKDPSSADGIYRTNDDQFYKGLHAGNDSIYGTSDDYYQTTSNKATAQGGYHIDADFDNNKDLLDTDYNLSNFSVADFVDYIQTLANARAINGGTMSRLNYAEEMLDENRMNLEAATSRIVDADMALESTKFARQNVLVQAGAAMVVQANQLSNIVLALLA